jgi:hypothetical protein
MRDGRVDEEVAGLLDPTARSARRSTDTTYGVIKAITACLVLVSAAALVLVRLSHLPRSVTLSRVLFARGGREGPRDPLATVHLERAAAEAPRASDVTRAHTPRL